jgi:hypothetical protein
MSETAFLMMLLLALTGGAAIFYPLMGERVFLSLGGKKRSRTLQAESLQEQLDQILLSIRDLDGDFDMGKVQAEDYIKHRKELIGRGVSILIRLDQALAQQQHLDEEIETLIQDYRRQQQSL